MINDILNKNILIKTYCFESGLWYLAKSLCKELEKRGNKVIFAPKSKYAENSGFWKRTYPEPRDEDEFRRFDICKFSVDKKIDIQIQECIDKYNIDYVISFETLMNNAQWVISMKSNNNIKIIDIPMPEWCQKNFVENNSYKIFDEIWAVNDFTDRLFSSYKTTKRVDWDFIDSDIFYPAKNKSFESINFCHFSSLNPDFSSKNTLKTLLAFEKFIKDKNNIKLYICGGELTGRSNLIARRYEQIRVLSNLSRQQVSDLYRKCHCLVAPSKKEGFGLSIHEAKKSGLLIVSTDIEPIGAYADFACKVFGYNKDSTLVDGADTSVEEIYKNIEKAYEVINMSKDTSVKEVKIMKKKKTESEIGEENSAFADALNDKSANTKSSSSSVDEDVLKKLKKKAKDKKKKDGDKKMPELIQKQDVSINLGVVGVGQAGSRLAEVFHNLGYDVGIINTSAQDLKYIEILDNQKLLIQGSLGGTGKDLDLGRELFDENEEAIHQFVEKVADGNDMIYLAMSGGGGTGSSSVETMVPMLFNLGMPVGVIYVLPKATEDAQSKRNTIETLSRLAKMTAENMVSSLVVVDNARIEQIYANLSQSEFWKTANSAIVEPLHLFNSLTSQASRFTSLDPSDFGKIISCGDCSIYGMIEVEDYMEETALAESVIESLGGSMLADGFDISQTRVGGVIITGSKEALDKLPAININYCFHIISEQTNGASIFQGVYDVDSNENSIKIYSWFAGLGLPADRIESLKKESQEQSKIAAEKESMRASAMTLDLDEDKINNVASEVHRKIQKKKSGFNKLQRGSRRSIIDKRRKR